MQERHRKIYHTLTVYGLTPWLALHLFYVMILSAFAWMNQNGFSEAAQPVAEALFSQFSRIAMVSELLMIPPFIYWFYLQISGNTYFPKPFAFTNILIIYGVMYGIKTVLPNSAFRIGFTNALMSESMFIWFIIMMGWMLFQNLK